MTYAYCPFCGDAESQIDMTIRVICSNCGAIGPSGTDGKSLWNSRPQLDETLSCSLDKEVEDLLSSLEPDDFGSKVLLNGKVESIPVALARIFAGARRS